MSKNITDNNLVADAKSVLKFWEEHSEINLNETTRAQFKKLQAAFQKLTDEIAQHEIELGARLTERDELGKELRVAISRLRSGVRAFFGPDSKEYEQVGGTRSSTRKRRARRGNIEGASPNPLPAPSSRREGSNGNGNTNGEAQEEAHTA
jgi:hypothetical protein